MTNSDNSKTESNWWKSLYNALFLLTIDKDELIEFKKLTFPLVDEFPEELEESLDVGINTDSLDYYVKNNWIKDDLNKELFAFYKFIQGISPTLWNEYDILNHSEWHIPREWAAKLFKDLKLERRGFDLNGTQIIYSNEE